MHLLRLGSEGKFTVIAVWTGGKMEINREISGGNGTFGNVLGTLRPRERGIESNDYFAVEGQSLRSKRAIRDVIGSEDRAGSDFGQWVADGAATDRGVVA
jgi:hypothetical protein